MRRQGRLTKRQEDALTDLWPSAGWILPELLDFTALFGRDAPVTLEIGFGMGASGGDGETESG